MVTARVQEWPPGFSGFMQWGHEAWLDSGEKPSHPNDRKLHEVQDQIAKAEYIEDGRNRGRSRLPESRQADGEDYLVFISSRML
jgi:hypothetical protein